MQIFILSVLYLPTVYSSIVSTYVPRINIISAQQVTLQKLFKILQFTFFSHTVHARPLDRGQLVNFATK